MAAFNLTAQINLRGPANLKPIVSQIRRELGTVNTDISLKIDNRAIKSIDSATTRLVAMNKALTDARNSSALLNQSLRDLSGSLGSVQSTSNGTNTSVKKTSDSIEKVSKNVRIARTEMEEFGKQSALAVRRFLAFAGPTAIIFGLTNAITQAFKAFISFDKELIRLQQVTGKGATGVKILQDEITNLATGLGVSSEALTQVATTLAQAGLNIEQTRIALKALAKTELAPSFENLTKTTEGAIAAIRQFGLEAGELEAALGSINAVAAAFAVESGDIIAAIQRTGGVFASASRGVSEGTDALNEFIAVFTSVRATTRESAETIATGLRTIFTRIQRSSTIKQLKEFGVELQDLEGKFVGPFEAVRRLSEALNQLDPRDIRFSTIVEELGGFRQIGKVIPLIQQFATAQQALGVAQRGQSSLTDAQIKAQQSLANQIAKVREQFLALIRDVGQSSVFQGLFKIVTSLASGLISLASAFKPILPILAVFGAIKGVSAIGQFATGFFGGLKKGGGAGGAGTNIGETISGAKEKQRAEATSKAADAIKLNTDALQNLTSAVQTLNSTIKSRGSTTLASGGKVYGFNRGGVVPGSGKGDKVAAMLEPGEVVWSNDTVNRYGRGNLVRMNKYAKGGPVSIEELKNINPQSIQPDYRSVSDAKNKVGEKDGTWSRYRSNGKLGDTRKTAVKYMQPQDAVYGDVEYISVVDPTRSEIEKYFGGITFNRGTRSVNPKDKRISNAYENYVNDKIKAIGAKYSGKYDPLDFETGDAKFYTSEENIEKYVSVNKVLSKRLRHENLKNRITWEPNSPEQKELPSTKIYHPTDLSENNSLKQRLSDWLLLSSSQKTAQAVRQGDAFKLGGKIQRFVDGGWVERMKKQPITKIQEELVLLDSAGLLLETGDRKVSVSTFDKTKPMEDIGKRELAQRLKAMQDYLVEKNQEKQKKFAGRKGSGLAATEQYDTQEMLDAITYYQAGSGPFIKALAGGKKRFKDPRGGQYETQDIRDRLLAASQFKIPKKTYSGLGRSQLKEILNDTGITPKELSSKPSETLKNLVGKTVDFPTFLSVSADKSVAEAFVQNPGALLNIDGSSTAQKTIDILKAKNKTKVNQQVAEKSRRLPGLEKISEKKLEAYDEEQEFIIPPNVGFKITRASGTVSDDFLSDLKNKKPKGYGTLENDDFIAAYFDEDDDYIEKTKLNLTAKMLRNGGKIQRFNGGSRGGIDWESLNQGRGSRGSRGARSQGDFLGIEAYQEWSGPIYDEYYNDPSLAWSSFLGIPMPPEIALYHKMVEDEVFTRGGAGLAVGKKFVRTPTENITDELRPYLEPDPSDPSQLGFYKEVIAKFAKQKAVSASQTAKLGKESALAARTSQLAAYSNAENAISDFKQTGSLSLDPSIMNYIKNSIANPDGLPLESKKLASLKKKLTKPNLDAFEALTGSEAKPVEVQGQRTALSEVFNSILETYGSDTGDLEIDNIIRGVGSKIMDKKFGGKIQKFVDGGKIQRNLGYIDYDVIANEANADVVGEGMKKAGVTGPRLYADYLTDLAVKARKEKNLDKLRAIYGVAGSGKTTLARGQGTDVGTLRETTRFPILTPEDIQKASEVLILTSSVSKDKMEGFLSEVDRAYTLSSTTATEQEKIRAQRTNRDITGVGLEGRAPGTTGGATRDTAVGEALLQDALGERSVVLGRTETGKLRKKSGDELVEVIKKRIGFTWGGFAPTTRGHESIIDSAAAYGISPEDFIALVGSDEGIKSGNASSYRTAILDQDARILLSKAGFGSRGATVLPKSRDFEVPQGFDIGQKGSRRQVVLPESGSMAFVADKAEEQLSKYKAAGYDVVNLPRSEGISGSMVRELIAAGDMTKLQEVLSPGVYDIISRNIVRLQNRASILPTIIAEVEKTQASSLADIENQIKAVGIARIDKKRVETDPEYAAKAKVLEELRDKRDKIKKAGAFEPYRLLAKLAATQPDKYALDFATSARSSGAPELFSMSSAVLASQPTTPSLSSMSSVVEASSISPQTTTTPFKPGESLEEIIKQIEGVGGGAFIRGNLGVDNINSKIQSRYEKIVEDWDAKQATKPIDTTANKRGKKKELPPEIARMLALPKKPTASQILDKGWLNSSKNDPKDQYLSVLQAIVSEARPIFERQELAKQEQIDRNLKAEAGGAYQFGLASIYGPNGELGYSDESDAQYVKTKDGQELLTRIVRRGLPKRYESAVEATREDIAGLSQRAGERMKYVDIFGTGGPLAFDFDETLVKGADIPGKNALDYNDLAKVEEALKGSELTLLGKELQKRLVQTPELMEGIRVLTARPQSNAPLLAETLGRLELPIPLDKITGVNGGLKKVENLSDLETLIDDNLENIQSVLAGGKKAIPYKEPKGLDLSNPSSTRSMQVIEGYTLEDMVRDQTGINIRSDDALDDPLKPIDFPKGLGAYAGMWNMPPNIPTDTKRSNTSTAASVMFKRAEKFYNDNLVSALKSGGLVQFFKEGGYSRRIPKLVPNDPAFEPRSISIGSKGIDYISILENSGLGLQSWLVDKLAFEAKTNQFSENEVLEYAQRLKEQMSSRPKTDVQNLLETLKEPSRFAIGGLAEATGSMQNLMSGLYGNRGNFEQSNKPKKNFGKIALRDSGSRIQATYMKEGQAGQDRSGQVIADKVNGSLYAVQSSAATKGYGPKLYDIVMEAATAAGGMLTSDRRTVSDAAKAVWAYYFKNRSDVKKTPLDPENWVSNSRLLDEKLYGPPETWPPSTDPAWILQTGYSKSSDLINTPDVVRVDPVQKAIANNEPYLPDILSRGGKISRFAAGGNVPAMVSNGEAFVPPKVAKKIGYAKLDRMNQADRNGMKGFAEGGISVFKGAGSGTSDSIGPIGLPTGSYVIREKATKALGLNKGGGVGIRKFQEGGRLSKEERKRRKEQFLADQRGGITRDEARSVGVPRPDFGAGASRRRDVMATPQGEMNVKNIEAEVLNNQKKLYAEEKKRIDNLYDQRQAEIDAQAASGTLSQSEAFDQSVRLSGERQQAKANVKAKLLAELPQAQAKAVKEYTVGKQTTAIEKRKEADTAAFSGEVQSGMDQVVKIAKAKYEAIYSEEQKRLKDYYQAKAKKVADEGGDVVAVIDEYKAAIGDLRQSVKSGFKEEVKQGQAKVPEQIAEQKRVQVEAKREAEARAADPFYDAKKAADASAAGMPGMPKVNEQIRQEQQQFFAYKAEKAGKTAGGFRQDLTKQIGSQAYAIGQERQFAKTEAQTTFAGRARELKGVDVAKATAEGATGEEASKVQGIIEEFAASLRKVDPNLGLGEARKAATKLAEGLAKGDQSVAQLIAGNEELQAVFNKTFSETENLDEAFRRVAEAAGLSEQSLRAEISPQKIKEQQFVSSKEGQKFGILSEIAPGLTESFSKTKIGQTLGSVGEFASGKGGRASKLFARVGGVTGIGGAVAGGTEALKQFLPQSVTSDPNTAGALGALGGAGTGAAVGAQLLAGIPFGPIVGGIGGAIIGGIQGFFNAKNQAILTNAIENVAKTTGELDIAFKKLEASFSETNLSDAQKAFGDVLAAGQPIEDLAFSKVGFENLGATFSGGVDKVSAGLAEGDVSKVILGGLQTAFGATGGGFLVDYFSNTEASRTEAIGAMVQGAGQKNEAAARLAEQGFKFKSTDELAAIFDSIKNGTNELNPITEQYVQGALKAAEAANGTKQLTSAQKEQITAQAQERAALDAYMKKRKEAGATDQQIAKEISKNSAQARKEGEEALRVQAELATKQALLASATKDVAVATESLLDVYRRIGAEADKYSNNLESFANNLNATLSDIGGQGGIRQVDRKNEQILANVSAFSIDEVKAAAQATAGFLGNTPEAQNLANQAVGQKLVQDQIPALLRAAKGEDPATKDAAVNQVRDLLAAQGLEGAAINTVLEDLTTKLAEGQGLTEGELESTIQKSFSTVGKGLEALQKVQKDYNDALQKARDFQNQYNKALSEAQAYFTKAAQVRLNAELDLAKALGRSPTLQQLNEPFDLEISNLTSGLVSSGSLAAEAAGDPMAIVNAIQANTQQIATLEGISEDLKAQGANIPPGAAGDPLRQQLNTAQLDNIKNISALSEASAQGRQALEKLANDGTKAANALSKIQEQQQAIEGFGNFAEKVFTAEPQELAKMEVQANTFRAAQVSGPEFLESRFNRQQAFAGLQQEREFMTGQEFRESRASLIRKSFESQINPATGRRFEGGDVVKKIGGKDVTLDELEKRLAGGVDETDPNVIAFREASAVQAEANKALGLLNLEQAETISQAMVGLEDFLSNQFPDILANAVTKAREDAQVKPEVKAAEKPRERSFAETRVAEGKEMAREGKARLDELKKEEEGLSFFQRDSENIGRINQERRKAKEKIRAGQELEARFQPQAEAEAAARTQQETAAAEAKKQADTEAQARKTEEAKTKAEQAIQRAGASRKGETPEQRKQRVEQMFSRPTQQAQAGVSVQQTQPQAAQAGVNVQQIVPQPVDETAKALNEEKNKAAAAEIQQLELNIAGRQKEIKQREARLKAARIAAIGAGTLKSESGEVVNPNVLRAQSSLDASKEALIIQQAQLEEKKQILSGQVKPKDEMPSPLDAALMTREEQKAAGMPEPPPVDINKIVAAFEALGFKGDDVVTQRNGKDITLDEFSALARGNTAQTTDSEVKSATEGVQTSVAQLQSPMDLVAQMATAGLQSGSIYTHDVGLQEGLGVLLESMNTLSSLASGEPGFAVSDAKVLEALNNLQAPFAALEQMAIASLSEGINTKDVVLAEVIGQVKPAIDAVSAGVSSLMTPIQSITSTLAPILLASANAANRAVSGPVPTTTAQQSAITNAQPTTPQTQDARLITVDPESIEKLNSFNVNFATYVDKLVTFEFPTIPDVIEMKGNHVVDVRISGAAAFEGLKKDFENMMQTEIKKAMGKIWDKTGGAMGASPNS